jgi:hypothetical protein
MRRPALHFALGTATAVLLLGVPAEWYLRAFPPSDVHLYLGEASPRDGPYRPDPDFGVTYRSWDTFYSANAAALQPFLPLDGNGDHRRLWAFFGNSFVQAPGMLADHARRRLPDHRIFNLGRNEDLCVRLAQIPLLLDHGLQAERIFVELMAVDLLILGEQPLSTIHVTRKGALTYTPRLPTGLGGWLVDHSALARIAWFRAGRQRGNPGFRRSTLYDRLGDPLLGDLRTLFGRLARTTQEHGIPVTIMLIPSHHQVLRGASYGFQDSVGALLSGQGYDIFDPRGAFGRYPTPNELFVSDKHLSDVGNELLLAELLAHVRALDARAASSEHSQAAGGNQPGAS